MQTIRFTFASVFLLLFLSFRWTYFECVVTTLAIPHTKITVALNRISVNKHFALDAQQNLMAFDEVRWKEMKRQTNEWLKMKYHRRGHIIFGDCIAFSWCIFNASCLFLESHKVKCFRFFLSIFCACFTCCVRALVKRLTVKSNINTIDWCDIADEISFVFSSFSIPLLFVVKYAHISFVSRIESIAFADCQFHLVSRLRSGVFWIMTNAHVCVRHSNKQRVSAISVCEIDQRAFYSLCDLQRCSESPLLLSRSSVSFQFNLVAFFRVCRSIFRIRLKRSLFNGGKKKKIA